MSLLSDVIRKKHKTFCSAVVVAAGSSTRMGADKLLLPLGGVPVLARTLSALNDCEEIGEIIVVTRADLIDTVGELRGRYGLDKVKKVVLGGKTRTESALAGVSETSPQAKILCIHDGARPFVTSAVIADAIHTAMLYHAAVPAVPVKDTVKLAEDGTVASTPTREKLFAVQTPQTFEADIVKAALTKAVQSGAEYTDDSAAVEELGVRVRLSRGDEQNIKITTPFDLLTAEAILHQREAAE